MPTEIRVENEAGTDLLGRILAEELPDGSVVALLGTLGAGKTRLVQGIAQASGIDPDDVGSPTFVLIREYEGTARAIYHFDAYRLHDSDEFLALGAEEYFDSDGLSFVEWADRVDDAIPSEHLEIYVQPLDADARLFTIVARGGFNSGIEERVARRWRELNGAESE